MPPPDREPTRFETIDREFVGRVPPQAMDVEMAVLGAMLRDSEACSTCLALIPDDQVFYRPSHRRIFVAARELSARGESVDLATVANQLEVQHDLDRVGGRAALVDIADSVFTAANAESHTRLILEKWRRRQAIQHAQRIQDSCFDFTEMEEIQGMHTELGEVLAPVSSASHVIKKGGFSAAFATLGPLRKVSSGLAPLDRKLTEGFIPGTTSVIAGRTSTGKSAFRQNLTASFCQRGMGVLVIGIEPTQRSEQTRLLSIKTGIDYDVLGDYVKWKDTDTLRAEMVERAAKEIDVVWNIEWVLERSFHSSEIEGWVRRTKQKQPLDIVFIDRFDMLSDILAVHSAYEKSAKIKEVLNRIAVTGARHNVHMSAVVQMKQGQGTATQNVRQYSNPMLDQMRESAALAEHSDLVLFTHRPGLYNRDIPDNRIEIVVGKQREGPAGVSVIAGFEFEGSTRRIKELPEDQSVRTNP